MQTPSPPAAASVHSVHRAEQKYLLQPDEALLLKEKLEAALLPDPNNGPNGYRVKSLYLDTPHNRDYTDGLDGAFARQKLRLRIYGEADQTVKLELKAKRGDLQRKTTLPLTRDEAARFAEGDVSFLLAQNTPQAVEIAQLALQGYRPVCVVQYQRSAYVWPHRNTRISLDSMVHCCEGRHDLFCENLPLTPVFAPGATVLEVKFDQKLEPFIRNLLRGYGSPRQAASKYTTSRMAADIIF